MDAPEVEPDPCFPQQEGQQARFRLPFDAVLGCHWWNMYMQSKYLRFPGWIPVYRASPTSIWFGFHCLYYLVLKLYWLDGAALVPSTCELTPRTTIWRCLVSPYRWYHGRLFWYGSNRYTYTKSEQQTSVVNLAGLARLACSHFPIAFRHGPPVSSREC